MFFSSSKGYSRPVHSYWKFHHLSVLSIYFQLPIPRYRTLIPVGRLSATPCHPLFRWAKAPLAFTHRAYMLIHHLSICEMPGGKTSFKPVRPVRTDALPETLFALISQSTETFPLPCSSNHLSRQSRKMVIGWLCGIRYCSSQNLRVPRLFFSHSI
jgi:hypothetical protein